MTTVTADAPEREEKPVSELERGTWVEVIDNEGDYIAEARVLHVENYTDETFTAAARSMLVYEEIGATPQSIHFPADMTLPVLTEAEVTAKLDEQRRIAVADQLRSLAELIVERELPLPGPYQHANVTFHFGRRIEDVDRIAELLGIERAVAYGTATVSLPDAGAGLLSIGWDAYAPKEQPKPEPEPEPMPDEAVSEAR